ncbi:uncharacterized protein STEHIDRAFT_150984 [Stereum hirsutum FP-91666 SS1]|uniref:Uncharacterized protein n=1 Tax=Stereum hirsutum (strain FP-91666) TaxID=721885 RepID=R7RYK8_STEHR|nr:uncharacterized protein STEHIDRAFT_150984 [Stereum hirsutum FP-91666 SS1]EIM79417.1 hypothetical protein STEHIDRAFT_150984 [Stereum hirsutum FP-91666 SS1]
MSEMQERMEQEGRRSVSIKRALERIELNTKGSNEWKDEIQGITEDQSPPVASGSQTSSWNLETSTDAFPTRGRSAFRPTTLFDFDTGRTFPNTHFPRDSLSPYRTDQEISYGPKCVLCKEGCSHSQCMTETIRNQREEHYREGGVGHGDPCSDCYDGHPHDFCM